MITTCTVCQTRYRLDASKVPPRRIRVRCPDCQGVFELDGVAAAAATPVAMDGLEPGFNAPAPAPAAAVRSPESMSMSRSASPEPSRRDEPVMATTPSPAVPSAPAATLEPVPEPTPASPAGGRMRRSKEEMLARALVSDILVYNRERRDTALTEGNLLEAMGAEIKKSWELYKEKVTPEVANSTNHFRDALNAILADGEKVF